MSPTLERLIPRYERGLTRMGSAKSKWQELADFMLPNQSNINRQGHEGQKKTVRLYHSKGITSPDKLARSMHGTVTSPAQKWFSLKMRDSAANQIKTIADWLEECADRMYLAINQSNFSSAAGEYYAALCVFGTGGMLVEESEINLSGAFGGLRFIPLPIGTYVIEQGRDGRVDAIFRRFEQTRAACFEEWGEDIGMEQVEKLKDKPDEILVVIHAIYKRVDRNTRRHGGPSNRPWASCYWFEATKEKIREGGYDEWPAPVTRWSTAQGEWWGTGPGHSALPDVRSLNRMRELKLVAGGKAVDPVMLAKHEAVLSSIDIGPASVITVDPDIEDPLKPLDTGVRFDFAALIEGDLEKAIGDIFYELELLLQDRPNMTATEVTARLEEKQRLLGPTMGRLQSEFLTPLIQRIFALMLRGGALPPPPEELFALDEMQADIDVEYEGPLARAQRSADLVAIDRVNMYLAGLAAATGDPSPWDNVDLDAQARHYAEVAGQPSNLNRDPKVVAQMRQQRAQALAQQQQAQMLMEGAKAAGAAAPMVKEFREGAMAREGVPA